jgi:hypothetical protein
VKGRNHLPAEVGEREGGRAAASGVDIAVCVSADIRRECLRFFEGFNDGGVCAAGRPRGFVFAKREVTEDKDSGL